MGTRCANHVTPLYPQNLALTSPTGGGRSVGMVRSRTKATEFSLVSVSKRGCGCVSTAYTAVPMQIFLPANYSSSTALKTEAASFYELY